MKDINGKELKEGDTVQRVKNHGYAVRFNDHTTIFKVTLISSYHIYLDGRHKSIDGYDNEAFMIVEEAKQDIIQESPRDPMVVPMYVIKSKHENLHFTEEELINLYSDIKGALGDLV